MGKSKRWSIKDIKVIKNYIADAETAGQTKEDGLKNAAEHFGVTFTAVQIRWRRFLNGEDLGGLNKNTTKAPIHRKKRKYTKKPIGDVDTFMTKHAEVRADKWKKATEKIKRITEPLEGGRMLTFDIKDVHVDLVTKKLTIIY